MHNTFPRSPAPFFFLRRVGVVWSWWTPRRPLLGLTLMCVALSRPTTLSAAVDLAEATRMFKSGQYLECIAATAEAIEEGQYSETWRLLKIEAELATGANPEALATLETALQRFGTSVRLRWLGGRVYRMNADPKRAAEVLDEIDELMDGGSWRYSDPASRVALGEFYLSRGVDPKSVLDALFNQVKRRNPDYAPAYVAAGRLALDKHDYALAAEEFQAALKHDATDPEVHLGLARAFAPSDPEQAQAALLKALDVNPRHVDSLLFLVDRHIDAERYVEAREVLRQALEVNVLEPRAWAYRAVLAHLENQPLEEFLSRAAALSWWRTNPEVDYLIGAKLSLKYRFAEAAARRRQALEMDPNYAPAKVQLAQDLLRLGDDEGWRLVNEANEADGYNVVAHNLITLRDNLSKFRELSRDGFIVRMDPREAEIYGQRVLDLLVRAKEALCEKYAVTLQRPVIVEIYPRQADFAIRTFGLPGGVGFLGVCFGDVITANSPASQAASPANWQATLWHEFCHVVTLNKTENKMPRWLSEGISVYEERRANPAWGQSMSPQYRAMILGEDLTPVSQLSGAFLAPESPLHLQFAYYESSLVVEYFVDHYGVDKLRRVLDDLAVGMPINESLARYAGSMDALDAEFAEHARQRALAFAAKADWETPDLPPNAPLELVQTWNDAHQDSFPGLQLLANRLIAARQWEQARSVLQRLRDLEPSFAEGGGVYAPLARVCRELDDTESEREAWEALAQRAADDVDAYLRLLELSAAAGDTESVMANAERLLAVSPLRAEPHRHLANAAEAEGRDTVAEGSLQALLLMDPVDPAGLQYRLSRCQARLGHWDAARLSVLKALEEAPRYRDAQRHLLEILRMLDENEQHDKPAPEPTSSQPTPPAPEAASPDVPSSDKPASPPGQSKPNSPEPTTDSPAEPVATKE